jgi:hypothetical protein
VVLLRLLWRTGQAQPVQISHQASGASVATTIGERGTGGLDRRTGLDRRLGSIRRRRLNARLLGAGNAVAWITGLGVALAIAAAALVGLR